MLWMGPPKRKGAQQYVGSLSNPSGRRGVLVTTILRGVLEEISMYAPTSLTTLERDVEEARGGEES